MKHHRYTLLCLGDSYTIGEAVTVPERFPMQTIALLKNERIDFEEPVIIAQTGWTTDELSSAIEQKNLTKHFDFVTLLIGVNNQYRGRDSANYRQEFRNLLNTALRYVNGQLSRVFVLSIPDWGVTPFGQSDKRGEKKIGEEIDMYNAINRDEAHKAGVQYIDITPVSRMAKTNVSLIATDGLHPSGNMYTMWAKLLAEKMRP